MAWNKHHDDMAIYLIVEHGFEVSPQFDNRRNVLYSFAKGPNEYHRTMEVFANAAMGASRDHARDEAVYAMIDWAEKLDAQNSVKLNPELLRQIASGNRDLTAAGRRQLDEPVGYR